ncbi:hypothetical protein [Nocardioides sp. KR10-350]|uniref:hypothetical protein n=1 Tax=Nocardioides cheoyonin TaxID=3156615 RepID=UPI0032B4CC73
MSTGWIIGFVVFAVVVLAVVALVLPILRLAHRIGDQAAAIDDSLQDSVANTAGLAGLRTTIDHAGVIVAGLARGRARLGG